MVGRQQWRVCQLLAAGQRVDVDTTNKRCINGDLHMQAKPSYTSCSPRGSHVKKDARSRGPVICMSETAIHCPVPSIKTGLCTCFERQPILHRIGLGRRMPFPDTETFSVVGHGSRQCLGDWRAHDEFRHRQCMTYKLDVHRLYREANRLLQVDVAWV